jgi:hypothetical protein
MIAAAQTYLFTGDPEQDEARGGPALIEELLPLVGELEPGNTSQILGVAAVLGDTETASRLQTHLTGRSPMRRFQRARLASIIDTVDGRIEDAAQELGAAVLVARESAVPLGEESCLIGFAALACKARDFERASRDLASAQGSVPAPFRDPVDMLLYRMTLRTVRRSLDPETAARCRSAGAAMSVSEALDAELEQIEAAGSPSAPG